MVSVIDYEFVLLQNLIVASGQMGWIHWTSFYNASVSEFLYFILRFKISSSQLTRMLANYMWQFIFRFLIHLLSWSHYLCP